MEEACFGFPTYDAKAPCFGIISDATQAGPVGLHQVFWSKKVSRKPDLSMSGTDGKLVKIGQNSAFWRVRI